LLVEDKITGGNVITRAGFFKPTRLNEGDLVALVSPSGPLRRKDRESLEASLELLKSWGLEPVSRKMARASLPFLAATDEERFLQMKWALTSPEIRAVFAVRGGHGTVRILPSLEPSWLRGDPKILMGFSDFTAVLLGLGSRAKVVGIHGPTLVSMGRGMVHQSDTSFLRELLMENRIPGPLEGEPWRGGVGEGPLIGGCLSLVTALLGTRFFPDLRGAILFLEDVNEPLYRVDRMLQQLRLSGVLEMISGLALGYFPEGPSFKRHLKELVLDATADGIPIVAKLPFGHGERNLALPVGCWARCDGRNGVLEIVEEPFA
jgi:muramoyltetrapeptide carboxypeptidase